MQYWLDLFTPYTWTRFREHGAGISGFRPRQRRTAARVKPGDLMLCYIVKLSRWSGILEVSSDAFDDSTPIFAEANDPYTIRFRVIPTVMLDFEHAIPIEVPELWQRLSLTRDLVVGSPGWAQRAKLRQSLLEISSADGELISASLRDQAQARKPYELDAADLRHIAQRTVVRTEQGEVEVEVPDRDPAQAETAESDVAVAEVRASIRVQAKLAQLGATLGFSIWVPPTDRARVTETLQAPFRDKLVTVLPLNYDLATLKTIENIDVI